MDEKTDIESLVRSYINVTESTGTTARPLYQLIKPEPHVFWAGREGKHKAIEATKEGGSHAGFKTDADIPFITQCWSLCRSMTELGKPQAQIKKFAFDTSRLFASMSAGPMAAIFLASDKASEAVGLTVGTNLYEAELPVLWKLLRAGTLERIDFYIHESKGTWQGPFKVTSKSCTKISHLPIYRRYAHPMDRTETKKSFVTDAYKQEDYDNWRSEPPRRYITLGQLHRMIVKWRDNARVQRHRRLIVPAPIDDVGSDSKEHRRAYRKFLQPFLDQEYKEPIPEQVYKQLRTELKRVYDASSEQAKKQPITPEKIRESLKQLGLSRYMSDSVYIYRKLNGYE